MQTTLFAVGRRMPAWVTSGTEEYTRRYPRHWSFRLREIAPASEQSADLARARDADALLGQVAQKMHLVALDAGGTLWSTEALAGQLEQWQALGKPLGLCIGGADGLHERVRQRADQLWSLSPLTLPHPLVRVVVAEQLYRAHSLLVKHPYHRA